MLIIIYFLFYGIQDSGYLDIISYFSINSKFIILFAQEIKIDTDINNVHRGTKDMDFDRRSQAYKPSENQERIYKEI